MHSFDHVKAWLRLYLMRAGSDTCDGWGLLLVVATVEADAKYSVRIPAQAPNSSANNWK